MIHRIKINRLNPDLSEEMVIVFRIAGTQDNAEAFGNRVRTRWMEANPGVPTTMVTDWPNPVELGGQHIMPDKNYASIPLPVR